MTVPGWVWSLGALLVGSILTAVGMGIWLRRSRTLSDTAADLIKQHRTEVAAGAVGTITTATEEAMQKIALAKAKAQTEIDDARNHLVGLAEYLGSRSGKP